MTTPAGEIHIDISHCGGHTSRVLITSSRPEAARLLLGKTPEQVLALIPLLFSVCGNAQAYAALNACRAALNLPVEPELDAAREILVQLETLREHAWRMLLDWRNWLGLPADKSSLAALLKFDGRLKQALFQNGAAYHFASRLQNNPDINLQPLTDLSTLVDNAIFQGHLTGFQRIENETELRSWLSHNNSFTSLLLNKLYQHHWMSVGKNPVGCLPMLDCETLNEFMQRQDLAALSRQPHWQSVSMETSALNRQATHPLLVDLQSRYGNGLLLRLLANLLEVANMPEQLTGLPAFPVKRFGADGLGIAQVQAARGLLIHRLVLRQGRVYDYRILAPTEWNFHQQGVVAQGLQNLQAADANALQQQADLFIKAVDPCVKYHLTLTEQINENPAHA